MGEASEHHGSKNPSTHRVFTLYTTTVPQANSGIYLDRMLIRISPTKGTWMGPLALKLC